MINVYVFGGICSDEFSATPSPSMANRRMRHSNLTPIMQSPSGASPHSRMPLAPAAARLFASPPPTQTAATTAPMEREYFTDMSTADYFNVPSAMGVAGPAAKQGGSMMQQAIVNNARAALTSASGAPRPRYVHYSESCTCLHIEMDSNLICSCFSGLDRRVLNQRMLRWRPPSPLPLQWPQMCLCVLPGAPIRPQCPTRSAPTPSSESSSPRCRCLLHARCLHVR
jgi:hypothetical protein